MGEFLVLGSKCPLVKGRNTMSGGAKGQPDLGLFRFQSCQALSKPPGWDLVEGKQSFPVPAEHVHDGMGTALIILLIGLGCQ